MCLEDTARIFNIRCTFGQFALVKLSYLKVIRIMTPLVAMLFYRSRNIHNVLAYNIVEALYFQ